MKGGHHPLAYARVCLRLALQRPVEPLARLGLHGVASRERVTGVSLGNRSFHGRFDAPGFPVLYAAEDLVTCEAEITHHLMTHYLAHAGPKPRVFTCQVLQVPLSGLFDDLRRPDRASLCAPTAKAYPAARAYAWAAFEADLDGLLYPSPRHPGGTCIARFLPSGMRIHTTVAGEKSFRWNGNKMMKNLCPLRPLRLIH